MGDTSISWTDKTWNPIRGCTRVSAGCQHCYAERQASRFAGAGQPFEGLVKIAKRDVRQFKEVNGQPTGEFRTISRSEPRWTGEVRFVTEHLADPLRWRKPQRVFVNSMSDLFHEKLTNEQIAAVFGVMAAASQHTFQVLTKRAKRMREWFEWIEEQREVYGDPWATILRETTCSIGHEHAWERQAQENLAHHAAFDVPRQWPLRNVWLGVSVENQAAADERIPELLRTPAAVRFLSCEPLLGEIDLRAYLSRGDYLVCPACRFASNAPTAMCANGHGRMVPDFGIDWVIAGCESGPGARPCDVAWLRSLRDQCVAAGVPYFLKQARLDHDIDGEGITEGAGSHSKGARSINGRTIIELPYLDGVQHAAFPEAHRG